MKHYHRLNQLHRYSGAFLALFITQHLLTHLVALHSPEAHIGLMHYTRMVYRNWLVEPLLWAAILLQVYSGIRLALTTKARGDAWARWQRYSGLYLAFFLLLHTSAIQYGRFVLGADTNFWYGAAVVQTKPQLFFFAPYYGLGILAYGVHLAALVRLCGLRQKQPLEAKHRAWMIVGVTAVVAGLILWAFMREMELPAAYVL